MILGYTEDEYLDDQEGLEELLAILEPPKAETIELKANKELDNKLINEYLSKHKVTKCRDSGTDWLPKANFGDSLDTLCGLKV